MKLQGKFLIAIGTAFIITFALSQAVQLWNVRNQIAHIGDQVIYAMNKSGNQAIMALQEREQAVMDLTGRFLENAVAASLERGEMEKFRKLVKDQKDVPGLIEFSLYNTDNRVGYSTLSDAMGRTIPVSIAEQLEGSSEVITLQTPETVKLYLPQHMNSDCVRCHREWADRETAGVLYVEMSTESLMRAKATAEKAVQSAKSDISSALGQTKQSMIVMSLSSAIVTLLILAAILTMLVKLQLTRRFSRFLDSFRKFSDDGDLTCDINDTSSDELGQLSRGFCSFTGNLSQTVCEIRELADRVNKRSNDITDRSRIISEGTETQREDLSAVATAVTEMAQSANQVAENASQASSAAQNSSDIAESGRVVIEDTLNRIEDIEQSSNVARGATDQMTQVAQEVRTILASITAISDQTSLLALNAAIEAARAGSNGRGFAVVADEVRTLAKRAATATKEVADAIDRIDSSAGSVQNAIGQMAEKVTEGTKFASRAGEHLAQIVQSAQEIAVIADQVAIATSEQSSVSEEISGNTHKLLSSAEINAKAAEETTQHANELRHEAESVTALIRHFKTQ